MVKITFQALPVLLPSLTNTDTPAVQAPPNIIQLPLHCFQFMTAQIRLYYLQLYIIFLVACMTLLMKVNGSVFDSKVFFSRLYISRVTYANMK